MSLLIARQFIRSASASLDPDSRYIQELLDRLAKARDIQEFKADFQKNSRARKWAGTIASKMTLEELILSSLVTHETTMERFDENEKRFLRKVLVTGKTDASTPHRVLSLPASLGLEAVSLAQYFILGGATDFSIDAFDIQERLINQAKTGKIQLPNGETYIIPSNIKKRINFATFDALQDNLEGNFDLIVMRNFLGYFKSEVSSAVISKVIAALKPGGSFMVDNFILKKYPEIFRRPDIRQLPGLPVFEKI